MTADRPGPLEGARGSLAGLAAGSVLLAAASLLRPATLPGADAPVRPPPGAALNAEVIQALPVGVRRLLADAAWLGAVQYYGLRRRSAANGFPHLRPLVDLALRFDPECRPAAVAGALLLAEPPPLGAGEVTAADEHLARWAERHPRDWQAVLVHGLVRSWHLGDPERAAAVFAAAARQPGAPDWFTSLAARSLTVAGERETARSLWRAVLARAPDGRSRANARTHLAQLEALDRLEALRSRITEFRHRTGRPPRGFGELAAAGLLDEAPPLDPAGTPFLLDPGGLPRIGPESPLAGYPRR